MDHALKSKDPSKVFIMIDSSDGVQLRFPGSIAHKEGLDGNKYPELSILHEGFFSLKLLDAVISKLTSLI